MTVRGVLTSQTEQLAFRVPSACVSNGSAAMHSGDEKGVCGDETMLGHDSGASTTKPQDASRSIILTYASALHSPPCMNTTAGKRSAAVALSGKVASTVGPLASSCAAGSCSVVTG